MMRVPSQTLARVFIYVIGIFLICEYLIYYVVLFQCGWPELDDNKSDPSITAKPNAPVRAMLLADTHLLGSRRGHWFDKLRREWQMHRAFQTAVSLHKPDVVFVLGDLFDEGLWCSKSEFDFYIARFHSLFKVPQDTKLYVIAGNHDIGFHYAISPYLHERFASAFDAPPIRLITIRGNHFVLINSMAFEGDGCFLCRQAELQLQGVSDKLKCAQGIGRGCESTKQQHLYSRPILLQHFPLYRVSDAHCNEPDEAPEEEKHIKFRERWECLSQESTQLLLDLLNPRAVVTGHVHHGCHTVHGPKQDVHEYTIPSFSWRNKDNPSFMMAVFSANNYAVSKCYMPCERTVFFMYILGSAVLLIWILRIVHQLSTRRSGSRPLRFFKTR